MLVLLKSGKKDWSHQTNVMDGSRVVKQYNAIIGCINLALFA